MTGLEYRYGDHHDQFARLSWPEGPNVEPWAVVVVVHGGFWRPAHGIELADPLAADLVGHGVAALAVEYRRAGAGGGWPATLLDVAAAVDALATQGQSLAEGQLDLSRVVAVGHSAGGQLVGWLAHRAALPSGTPGSGPLVGLLGAVAQGGVLDLGEAARLQLGRRATQNLMGGEPTELPDAYRLASPIEHVGDGARVACVHGVADDVVPISQSQRYRDAAVAAGDPVSLISLPGVGHMELVDPGHEAWRICRAQVLEMLAPAARAK